MAARIQRGDKIADLLELVGPSKEEVDGFLKLGRPIDNICEHILDHDLLSAELEVPLLGFRLGVRLLHEIQHRGGKTAAAAAFAKGGKVDDVAFFVGDSVRSFKPQIATEGPAAGR